MGRIAEQLYKLSVLSTGLYGSTQGWHNTVGREINRITDGGLDSIVQHTPALVQPVVEMAPYALLLYTAMELGGRMLAKRKLNVK